MYIHRLVALPIGRHFKLRENVTKPVQLNDTLEKLFRQHRKIYPSDSVILVMVFYQLLSVRALVMYLLISFYCF